MKQFNITGMSCAACSARVEKAVSKVDGVTACSVSLLTNSLSVEGEADENLIISAVTSAGYGASVKGKATSLSSENTFSHKETPGLLKRLISSLIFLVLLMYVSMGHTMWGWPLPEFLEGNPIGIGLLQLLLSAIVMVINQKFFISGFSALIKKSPNMDTLVALGSGASFIYSTVVLFMMTGDTAHRAHLVHEFYFESAAMILALITLGKMLEARSKGKTTDALKSLISLTPKTALIYKDGKECEVPASDIKIGDIFLVKPGSAIPADGVVTEGFSAVSEAPLTGESIPVEKTVGDSVSAGCVNQSGFMKCKATQIGEGTALSQIIKMVENAAATKAPIAKVADKVSGIFVPVVIIIAIIAAAIWLIVGESVGFALARGISVLVISCPCALGLATPVAIMVSNGIGAKNGILFKTAAALEEAGRIQVVALDKTGTITLGEPSVTDILPIGTSENELLTLACTLESKSEHPLAKAIVSRAESLSVLPKISTDFEIHPGGGLEAKSEGAHLLGGNLEFIGTSAAIPEEIKATANALADAGKTPLFFAKDGVLSGIIAVSDTIRPDSAKAIAELKNMGIYVVMLTGDNHRTARAVQKMTGIDEVVAGVLPGGKEEVIKKLKLRGKTAMVGDGINDAPALKSADIGIAIGRGTDVAIDAADVVLTKSNLSDVPSAVRLGRKTLKNIRENLFWAFIYNVIGIPLAAGVWIPVFGLKLNPMFGAAAMSLSSFCVVANALRLNLYDIKNPSGDKKIKQKKEKKVMEKTLKIEGMMCPHCEARVKKVLEEIDGVTEAVASHESKSATVKLSKDVPDELLKKAIEGQGYSVL